MKPLVIVDLVRDRPYGPRVVASQHQHTAPDRPLVTVGPKDDLEATFARAAGIQVTGTPTMLDNADWAPKLSAAIEAAAGRGIPVLGICFGHQMLGVHFGAKLESWEAAMVGIAPVRFGDDAGGPFPAGEEIPMMFTHRDHLTAPGPNLDVVGTGGFGGIAAWKHRTLPVWGIQAHPEATALICRRAERQDVGHLTDEELDTVEAKTVLARFGALLQD